MYYQNTPSRERRDGPRVRVEIFLNQYIRDLPFRSLAMNLSPTGLLVQRLVEVVPAPRCRTVALELELPGTGEVVWARAETRFDFLGDHFHTTGLCFSGIANKHLRLLRDFVWEKRLAQRPRTILGLPT